MYCFIFHIFYVSNGSYFMGNIFINVKFKIQRAILSCLYFRMSCITTMYSFASIAEIIKKRKRKHSYFSPSKILLHSEVRRFRKILHTIQTQIYLLRLVFFLNYNSYKIIIQSKYFIKSFEFKIKQEKILSIFFLFYKLFY